MVVELEGNKDKQIVSKILINKRNSLWLFDGKKKKIPTFSHPSFSAHRAIFILRQPDKTLFGKRADLTGI